MKKYFYQKNTVKGATVILVITLIISNLLGMVRDHYLAQKVVVDLLDTYYAAFRIPDLLFNTIILGAVSSAFIPVFTKYLALDQKKKANDLASAIATVGMAVIVVLSALLFFTMPYIIPLLVPSFTSEKQEVTLSLARMLLLSPVFFGFSYFLSAIMNSHKRFFISSLAPLVYNLSIIIATIFFSDKYGVYAVGWGVVIGAFFHMAIQLIPLKHLGVKLRLSFNTAVSGFGEVSRLMLPRAIGLGALQMMLFAFTVIASGLPGGSIAIFNLADNIQTLPTVVFGTSVASALFPTLSESFSLGRTKDFANYLQKAIVSILFFLIPASLGLILLRIQVVRLILGSGHFGWSETILTAEALGFFAIALTFAGLIPLFARTFYALNNTKTPTIYAVISVFISVTSAIILTPFLGVSGLALAFSIGNFINCTLLYAHLRRILPDINESEIIQKIVKIVIATLAMGVSVQLTKIAIGTIFNLTLFIEVAIQAGMAMAIGAAVYFTVSHLLGFGDFSFVGLNKIFGYFTGGINGKKTR